MHKTCINLMIYIETKSGVTLVMSDMRSRKDSQLNYRTEDLLSTEDVYFFKRIKAIKHTADSQKYLSEES